jgi:hypothetical protein
MSHNQKAGQRHRIKIANRPFEDVIKFRYLGTTVRDQNSMLKEIKSRLMKSGNACFSLLSFRLLSRNVKVKI